MGFVSPKWQELQRQHPLSGGSLECARLGFADFLTHSSIVYRFRGKLTCGQREWLRREAHTGVADIRWVRAYRTPFGNTRIIAVTSNFRHPDDAHPIAQAFLNHCLQHLPAAGMAPASTSPQEAMAT